MDKSEPIFSSSRLENFNNLIFYNVLAIKIKRNHLINKKWVSKYFYEKKHFLQSINFFRHFLPFFILFCFNFSFKAKRRRKKASIVKIRANIKIGKKNNTKLYKINMKSNVIHKKARSHLYNFYDMQQRESEGKHVLFPFFSPIS